MWKVRGLPWHERRIYHTLTSISVFPFFQLLQLLECISRYMCGDNVTIRFPPDFHDYTGLNGFVNCFPWFTVATPNEMILGCKPHWSAKRKKKQHHVRNDCSKVFWKTAFLKVSQNSQRNTCATVTLLRVFTPSGL